MKPHPIYFRLATLDDRELIHTWWNKPHVKAFWDNSPEMWQNVENFLRGHKDIFDYWLAYYDAEPFALVMSSKFIIETDSNPYNKWIDRDGLTLGIDFMIGDEKFLGKKLSSPTLEQFIQLMQKQGATSFLIDPAITNPRAIHVYQKAGFKIIDSFVRNSGYFAGVKHYLMKWHKMD